MVVPQVSGSDHRPETTVNISVPADYVVRVRDVVVGPRQILLKDWSILPDTLRRYDSKLPHHILPYHGSDRLPSMLFQPASTVEGPAFFFDGEHTGHYGHFLLEVLPRLWCWEQIDLSGYALLTSNAEQNFVQKLIVPFGLKLDQLYHLNAPTLARDLTIAKQPYVLERTVSANARKVFKQISEWYDAGSNAEKIYISRQKFGGQRQLVNEADVEALFEEHGFKVIYPELLPIEQQIDIFGNARVIAGPSGSAMYNLVFGRRKKQVLVLASSRFVTTNDALVNHGSDCRIYYVSGTAIDPNQSGMKSPWSIDIEHVREAITMLG